MVQAFHRRRLEDPAAARPGETRRFVMQMPQMLRVLHCRVDVKALPISLDIPCRGRQR